MPIIKPRSHSFTGWQLYRFKSGSPLEVAGFASLQVENGQRPLVTGELPGDSAPRAHFKTNQINGYLTSHRNSADFELSGLRRMNASS